MVLPAKAVKMDFILRLTVQQPVFLVFLGSNLILIVQAHFAFNVALELFLLMEWPANNARKIPILAKILPNAYLIFLSLN